MDEVDPALNELHHDATATLHRDATATPLARLCARASGEEAEAPSIRAGGGGGCFTLTSQMGQSAARLCSWWLLAVTSVCFARQSCFIVRWDARQLAWLAGQTACARLGLPASSPPRPRHRGPLPARQRGQRGHPTPPRPSPLPPRMHHRSDAADTVGRDLFRADKQISTLFTPRWLRRG